MQQQVATTMNDVPRPFVALRTVNASEPSDPTKRDADVATALVECAQKCASETREQAPQVVRIVATLTDGHEIAILDTSKLLPAHAQEKSP